MSATLTNYDAMMKQYYEGQRIPNLVYKKNPLFALMKKKAALGNVSKVPMVYGDAQSRSSDFAVAQAAAIVDSGDYAAFSVDVKRNYQIVRIDNMLMELSASELGSFMKAKTSEINGAFNNLSRDLSGSMYRSGWGERGQVANTAFNVTTVTLTQAEDIVNFEVGMSIGFAAALATGALRGASPFLSIVSVNRAAGTFVVSAALDTLSGGGGDVATNDFMFCQGDRQNTGSPVRQKLTGLAGWIPYTAPTSGDSFFGVDRSVDSTRLAGQRLDISNMPMEEGLIDLAALVHREGGRLTHFAMSFGNVASLQKQLGSRVEYVDLKVSATIGFRGIVLQSNYGDVVVLGDQNCPSNFTWGVDLDSWRFISAGDPVRFLKSDGLDVLRVSNADEIEARIGSYSNVYCDAPGFNCIGKLK